MTAPDDRLLTVDEVSDLIRVPSTTLAKWRQREQGPQSFKMVHRVVYYESVVLAWVARQQAATSKGESAARPSQGNGRAAAPTTIHTPSGDAA